MWIKLEDIELEKHHKEIRQKRFKTKLLIFSSVSIFLILVAKLGIPYRDNPNPIPMEWHELVITLPEIIGFSLFVTFAYTFRGSFKKVRCLSCEDIKWADKNDKCTCGGTYYPVDDMIYIIEKDDM